MHRRLFVPRVTTSDRHCDSLYDECKSTVSQTGDYRSIHQLQAQRARLVMLECRWYKVWRVCNSSQPRYNFRIIKLKCFIFSSLILHHIAAWIRTKILNRRFWEKWKNSKALLLLRNVLGKNRKLKENVRDGNERNFLEWKWIAASVQRIPLRTAQIGYFPCRLAAACNCWMYECAFSNCQRATDVYMGSELSRATNPTAGAGGVVRVAAFDRKLIRKVSNVHFDSV